MLIYVNHAHWTQPYGQPMDCYVSQATEPPHGRLKNGWTEQSWPSINGEHEKCWIFISSLISFLRKLLIRTIQPWCYSYWTRYKHRLSFTVDRHNEWVVCKYHEFLSLHTSCSYSHPVFERHGPVCSIPLHTWQWFSSHDSTEEDLSYYNW